MLDIYLLRYLNDSIIFESANKKDSNVFAVGGLLLKCK